MTWRGKTVLVTGADGFIGSHVAEALVRAGANVRAFALYNSFASYGWLDQSPVETRDAMEIVLGDIRDPHGVRAAMIGADVVLHLAALIAIPFSYQAPDAYIDTNVKGTLNIVQAARDLEIARVVCTSTSEVYGSAQFVPITEDHPLVGQSPYSASKIGADQMALSFHKSFGTPISVLRPFNTYGPRQSMRAVIPTILTQALAGAETIKVGALTPTRDFTFVADTARAFLEIAACDAALGEVVNVGSGFEISIGDLAHLIVEAVGSRAEIVLDKARLRPDASEVDRLFAGVEKAESLWGWKADYGGLDGFRRGLKETADWFAAIDRERFYPREGYVV